MKFFEKIKQLFSPYEKVGEIVLKDLNIKPGEKLGFVIMEEHALEELIQARIEEALREQKGRASQEETHLKD